MRKWVVLGLVVLFALGFVSHPLDVIAGWVFFIALLIFAGWYITRPRGRARAGRRPSH